MLEKMQSLPDAETQRSLELLVNRILQRVYSGIDVDKDGIDRLRQLSQEGSVAGKKGGRRPPRRRPVMP